MTSFPHLFSKIRIGSLELRNRLVMSPMETGYAEKDGRPSSRTIAYYEARARGGVGLITLGACTIDAAHREVPRSMDFASDGVIDRHRELTDRVHAHGACIQPQLMHPGPDGLAPYLSKIDNVGPSVIPSYLTGIACRELESHELPAIVDQYRAAATRAKRAGYDGAELHAAHGYMLLGSFLTPGRNQRRDDYAGNSEAGRIRLVVEVLRAIKQEVGADFPLTLRISGDERRKPGRDLADSLSIAPKLVAAGVDAFHVSGGVIDALTSEMVTGSHYDDGHNVAEAAAIKGKVDVPVMAVARIHDPSLAEEIVREGRADLIAMGRPLLADAEFANKARFSRGGRLRRCISCQNCIDSMEKGRMSCAINPFTGREEELALERCKDPKKVIVIGGGPAGLEAARIASLRGHSVRLYEASENLGGALVAAARVHPENQPFLDYLLAEVLASEIDVHLNQRVDANAICEREADAVIVATGGTLVVPAIAGSDRPHVLTARTLLDLPKLDSIGPRVAIIGATLAAIELAEFLAREGRAVDLLAGSEELASEVGPKRRAEHVDRLQRLGVAVHMTTRVTEIGDGEVRLENGRSLSASSVVLAGEVAADLGLQQDLVGRVPEVFAIGDCNGWGGIAQATEEAARAACAIR